MIWHNSSMWNECTWMQWKNVLYAKSDLVFVSPWGTLNTISITTLTLSREWCSLCIKKTLHLFNFHSTFCSFPPVTLGTGNKSIISCLHWASCRQSWIVTSCVWSARPFPLVLLTCVVRGLLVWSTWCGSDAVSRPWRSQWVWMDPSTSCTTGEECPTP